MNIHFKMVLNQWKEYKFNFKADYYKKYGRYPDTDRKLVLYSAQDYWAGGSEMWVDNILGEPGVPCTDEDGDTYVSEACGGNDCNDLNSAVNPGVTEAAYGDPVCTDGIGQRLEDVLLSDDFVPLERAPFAVEGLGHINNQYYGTR